MKQHRFSAYWVAAGVVSVVAAMGFAFVPNASAAPKPRTCSLVNEPLVISSAQPDQKTQQFAAYGDTSGDWIGADSTYSVVLKDGRTAWLFSDTILGTVVDGAVDMDTMGFINNSFVIESGGELTETITGWGDEGREGIFGPPAENSWYWLGAGYVAPNGLLYVGINEYEKYGPGLWDWGWNKTSIATVNPRTWNVTKISPLDVDSDVQWTSWFQRTNGKTYIYGVHDQGALKQAHVARVAGHDISRTDKWQYWTGNGWSRDAAKSVPILDHVANEYSVTPFRDGYLFVTQDTSVPFSTEIVAYTSCSPLGPFENRTTLFNTPEAGLFGSYGDPNIFTYNAHVHPQLSDHSQLLISYNVNTFDSNHIFDDVTIYQPRFWTVTVAD